MDLCKLSPIAFLITYLLSIISASDIGFRSLFKCEPCNRELCLSLPSDCELVREPGLCSCCLTCAREEGQSCGLTVGRCGRGYKCRPSMDDPEPLLAMMFGRASCLKMKTPKSSYYYNKSRYL